MNKGKQNPIPAWGFKMMALMHNNPLRRWLDSPTRYLDDAGIKKGDSVLEVGCAGGFFTKPIAERVGMTGVVYALDNHPLAIEAIQKRVRAHNVKPIFADAGHTTFSDESIDVAFVAGFFGVLDIIREMGRVLKPGGIVAIQPTGMSLAKSWVKMRGIIESTTELRFETRGKRMVRFRKIAKA